MKDAKRAILLQGLKNRAEEISRTWYDGLDIKVAIEIKNGLCESINITNEDNTHSFWQGFYMR